MAAAADSRAAQEREKQQRRVADTSTAPPEGRRKTHRQLQIIAGTVRRCTLAVLRRLCMQLVLTLRVRTHAGAKLQAVVAGGHEHASHDGVRARRRLLDAHLAVARQRADGGHLPAGACGGVAPLH